MDKIVEDVEKRVEWLHCENYFAAGDIFGEPQKTCRVGDDYQAQIPSLMSKNELLQLICHDVKTDVKNHFEFGLSIPVTWNRSRKSVPGKKIFKGWKRQELLSRLLPKITNECKTSLTKVISSYDDGKLSFENYVLTLRDIMGINYLVEAVAIGNEKMDLATKTKKRVRRNKKPYSACSSSFKTEEIANILKDSIGFSEESLDDLFWEAVWPRLLAKGWHSEQPRNYACQTSKNSLVFLAPGIVKFSRRSLEKGSQYFDSITDVLNKVASEPQLLDHKPNQDGMVKRHAKRGSEDEQDLVKCTIVDTALVGLVKVRKLSSLPVFEPAHIQASSSVIGETEQIMTEESKMEDDQNHHTVVESPDCETRAINKDTANPVVFQRKPKRHQVCNTRNDSSSSEDAAVKDQRPMKKCRGIVINLNNPRVGAVSDDENLVSFSKPFDLTEKTRKEAELPSPSANGPRQSTRNRPLTTKALEALANGFLNPKKRRGAEDTTSRCVRTKTALVSSCGARYSENRVDGLYNGSSHMVTSPK
nr:homeodomain-like protein [Tanacetum cinerariifolium]